jgi:hypothetical protein
LGVPHFTRDQSVVAEMPPEVISKFLRSAVHFPAPENIEIISKGKSLSDRHHREHPVR